MILQGNYTDNTKGLIEALNTTTDELNAKGAELERTQAELADADEALRELSVEWED